MSGDILLDRQDPTEVAALWVARMSDHPLSKDEHFALGLWLAEDPAHQVELDAIQSLWEEPVFAEQLESYRREDTSDISVELAVPSEQPARSAWRVRFGYVVAAAASIAVVLALAMGTLVLRPDASRAPGTPLLVETVPGKLRDVRLADGSTVALNGGTRLHVQLGGAERRLELEDGEAFFDVAHDPAHPFVVHAGGVRFTAVGTRFSVTTFKGQVLLLVSQGRVQVDCTIAGVAPQIYSAGTQVVIGAGGRSFANVVSIPAQPSWREGWLDTAELSLADLITTLNRRTGSDIAVSPEVAALTVSGRFRIDQVDMLLHSVKLMYGLKVEVRNGHDVLVLDRARQHPAM